MAHKSWWEWKLDSVHGVSDKIAENSDRTLAKHHPWDHIEHSNTGLSLAFQPGDSKTCQSGTHELTMEWWYNHKRQIASESPGITRLCENHSGSNCSSAVKTQRWIVNWGIMKKQESFENKFNELCKALLFLVTLSAFFLVIMLWPFERTRWEWNVFKHSVLREQYVVKIVKLPWLLSRCFYP